MSREMRPGWRHIVRRVAAGTTLLVIAGGLTACGDKDPAPTATATHPATARPTSSPTPTPTPTLAPDQIPPTPPAALTDVGADGATKDEAIQVAEYFLALYAYSFATNNISAWDQLSSPNCTFCASVKADVAAQAEHGGHAMGGVIHLSDADVLDDGSGANYLYTAKFAQSRMVVLDNTSVEVASVPEASGVFLVAIQHSAAGWSVLETEARDQ